GGAFTGCDKLTEVELPENLKEIGEGAFKGCTGLTNVNIPDGVTTIEKSTFEGCENLTEIELPENLKEIGEGAFKGCKELTNLILPPRVDNVGEGAFEGCDKLTKPAYPSTLEKNPFESEYAVEYDPETDEITPDGWIVSKNKTTLVYAPTDLEGEYTVDTNVTEIGKNAFVGCDNLTTISIEGSSSGLSQIPMTIGENAFAESGVETLNINRNWIVDGDKTPFPNLTKVNIGENVQDIPANAFNGSQLAEVDIPENVTTIGANAFNCDATEGVSIADGVYNLYIAANAFSKDANLAQVYVGRPVMGTPFAGTGVVNLAIGNHITSVVKGAYQGCAAMQSLKLGTGITEIADEAFEGCSSLEEVVIPPFTEKIGSSAFANSGVRDLLIGHSVTAIGEKAFAGANIDVLKITAVVAPKMSANTFSDASAKVYVQHPDLVAHYQGVDHWKAFTDFDVLAMATKVNMTMNGGAVTTLHGPAGATFQLEASVEHEAEGEKLDHIFWFSTNPEVVTVNHDGLVTLKQALGTEGQQSPALRASRAAATQVIAHTAYAEGPLMAVDPESGQMSYIQDATSDYINGLLNGLLNVEIYNLDGVKVSSNPDELIPGIYIVRQNGDVKKIT
ncbi:MAG: leucine-rich repeat domain-containing protein, partial [Muribaculaceae bacterium]|nr:leucine-rich repeat domain-containing protein [Muribaculaceae bacterium]